jgi:hypothetical protein
MTTSIVKGGKRGKGSRRRGSRRQNQNQQQNQNQNQNQQQNQQGGACGNSSSVAASYGGNVPMNVLKGGELQSSNYTAGNVVLVKGGAGLIPNMNMGGNGLFKGGNIIPQIGNGLIKGGNVPMPGMPGPVMPTTGGSVLNELAVPAVLLYANNTFGKKKNYTGKKFRRSGKKSRRVRRR